MRNGVRVAEWLQKLILSVIYFSTFLQCFSLLISLKTENKRIYLLLNWKFIANVNTNIEIICLNADIK